MIYFGFVKLNTGKKKITYMLIREGNRITRLSFPCHDAAPSHTALPSLNINLTKQAGSCLTKS